MLTDGDAVFQPHKVERAGIAAAVDGHVLVYVHKELALDDVERRYPAERYVLVDDKLRILTAAKQFWGERVTTVLPLQGQFATDPEIAAAHPAADVTVDGDRRPARLRSRASSGASASRAPPGQSSTQRRKPPRNASSLWPRRQFGGSSSSSRGVAAAEDDVVGLRTRRRRRSITSTTRLPPALVAEALETRLADVVLERRLAVGQVPELHRRDERRR